MWYSSLMPRLPMFEDAGLTDTPVSQYHLQPQQIPQFTQSSQPTTCEGILCLPALVFTTKHELQLST